MPRKPTTPQKVYDKEGNLLYKIVKYVWVPKGSILGTLLGHCYGWFPIKEFNLKHPEIFKMVTNAENRLKEYQRAKHCQTPWERLHPPMTT